MQPYFDSAYTIPARPAAQAAQPTTTDPQSSIFAERANHVIQTARTSRWFRLHCWMAFFCSAASFIIWTFVAMFHIQFPWFVVVGTVFALTLSAHYYYFEMKPRDFFSMHASWFVILSTFLVITSFATSPTKAWFFPVLLAGLVPLAAHYTYREYKDSGELWIREHTTVFLTFNAFCFGLWLYLGGGFPWFIFTFYLLAIPLAIHWNWAFHKEGESIAFRSHAAIFGCLNLLFFFTWMATDMGFPWFFFTFIGMGLILASHFYVLRRSARRFAATEAAFAASTPTMMNSSPFSVGGSPELIPPSELRTVSGMPSSEFQEVRIAKVQVSDPRMAEGSV